MMHSTIKLAITGLCLVLAWSMPGCNSRPKPQKLVRAPAPPPSYPPARPMLLDDSLRDLAKRQILTAIESTDPIVRANAVEAAQDGLGAGAREQILAALDDSEPVVR